MYCNLYFLIFSGVGPYDIGLLKLASPFKLNNNVQAIELAPPGNEPTGEAWLCGWGSISTTNYPIMPNKLQHVKMEYVNRTTCHESVKRLTGSSRVHETNICTGSLYDKISACKVSARRLVNSVNNNYYFVRFLMQ